MNNNILYLLVFYIINNIFINIYYLISICKEYIKIYYKY